MEKIPVWLKTLQEALHGEALPDDDPISIGRWDSNGDWHPIITIRHDEVMPSSERTIVDTGWDAVHNGALRSPAPYYAKVVEKIDNGKGYWNYLRVGVFERETTQQIGEYKRNYSSLYRTFHPFKLYDKWYALYSPDYTATRIMELPSCSDIGGEERAAGGFCPTDFWVPPLHHLAFLHNPGCPRDEANEATPDYTKPCTCPDRGKDGTDRYVWSFPDRVHGFVAGCVWGDDSSWKIQYLDLSKANEGIIKREERFGYIEMPSHLTLDKAIDLEDPLDADYVTVSVIKRFNLNTGRDIDAEDTQEEGQ